MRRLPFFMLPMLLAASAFAQNEPRTRLALDAPAPEVMVTTVDGKGQSLAGLRSANPGKVIVLQFASISDPIFRAHVSAVERVADKSADKACFVIVYGKEAHPDSDPLEVNKNAGFNLPEPRSLGERQKRAQLAIDELHILRETMLVDAWNDASSVRYGSLPNMTFVVDAKGVLRAAYPFMDAAKVQAAVDALAADKALPDELKGSLQGNGPAPFDFAAAAAEMTGGRGPASIAAALERATLTDPQKQAVLVAIAEFMADVQEFRQARGGGAGGAATRGAATAPARGGAAAGRGRGNPEEVQAAQSTLRDSADRLKAVVKKNMSAKDAAALYAALDNVVPAQRLFTNP
jgi:hypothetical protein